MITELATNALNLTVVDPHANRRLAGGGLPSSDEHAAAHDEVTHVHAFTRVNLPRLRSIPLYVLYRVVGDRTDPFVPLIDFFVARGAHEKLSWQRNMVRSVGLLLDYVAAAPLDTTSKESPATLLQGFVDALWSGTDGHPLGDRLRWSPRSASSVAQHLARVTEFSDWLAEHRGCQRLNPWRQAGPAERLILMRRAQHLSQHALLTHAAFAATDRLAESRVREVRVPAAPSSTHGPVKAFSDEAFQKLVTLGWSRRASPNAPLARRYRLRDLMISILLHAGGLRVSEAFHVFLKDVVPDPLRPGSARVLLYHPSRGAAPDEPGGPWRDRKHYLAQRWGMKPRTLHVGGLKAGWKNLAVTDSARHCTEVFWFAPAWGVVFWQLYVAYLQVRPKSQHPFLFVSEQGARYGRPYTIKAFLNAHRRAVRRAGLAYGKHVGTSVHGHRHRYGAAARRAGLEPYLLQRAMRHRSIASQEVYAVPDAAFVNEELEAASARCTAYDFPSSLLERFP